MDDEEVEVVDRGNLTDREVEVFKLLCEGFNNAAISRRLSISPKTIEKHVSNIYEKLGTNDPKLNSRCLTLSVAIANKMIRFKIKGDQ
jgi:DNA-binding NarL/FixJ family response regulator